MSERDEGGPAFPALGIRSTMLPGISLREYFAAHAPALPAKIHEQFMAATKRSGETDLQAYAKIIAEWRFWYADAMLAERGKR